MHDRNRPDSTCTKEDAKTTDLHSPDLDSGTRIRGSADCRRQVFRTCHNIRPYDPSMIDQNGTHSNNSLKNHTSRSSFLSTFSAQSFPCIASLGPLALPSSSYAKYLTLSRYSSPLRLSGT